ncbi:MAG: hypothetical protein M3N57_01020 [Actinomycetota bacterium]|nr:hypothetical protein [Actinomycetota bacterium]
MNGDHDIDRKARRAWRIAGYGTLVVGSGLAAAGAAGGASGETGMVLFLLGALVTCGAGTLYAIVSGAVDQIRDQPVGRARVRAAVALGALTMLLPLLLVGAAR